MRWDLTAVFALVFGLLLIIKGLDTLTNMACLVPRHKRSGIVPGRHNPNLSANQAFPDS